MFIAVLFTIAMTWKQHKCLSIDKWVKKISICLYIYIHTTYIYSSQRVLVIKNLPANARDTRGGI